MASEISLKTTIKNPQGMQGIMVHIFNPSTGEADTEMSEFQPSLVYTVSSRVSQSYIVRPCLEIKKK